MNFHCLFSSVCEGWRLKRSPAGLVACVSFEQACVDWFLYYYWFVPSYKQIDKGSIQFNYRLCDINLNCKVVLIMKLLSLCTKKIYSKKYSTYEKKIWVWQNNLVSLIPFTKSLKQSTQLQLKPCFDGMKRLTLRDILNFLMMSVQICKNQIRNISLFFIDDLLNYSILRSQICHLHKAVCFLLNIWSLAQFIEWTCIVLHFWLQKDCLEGFFKCSCLCLQAQRCQLDPFSHCCQNEKKQ